LFFIARANQKIPNLALGRESSEYVDGSGLTVSEGLNSSFIVEWWNYTGSELWATRND
jgi:hypothetical protein